ncbi:MAG: C69 family dipeptidase [Candidatus Krumholzibacteria bacterium]|nr:C69 family dipeptidase [Candidatus Krumholzibacteria bacterium]
MKSSIIIAAVLSTLLLGAASPGSACTNFLITKGASADGSTMITYSADSHELCGDLSYLPARDFAPGTLHDVYEWDTGKFLGRIPEVLHTYSVVGLMNEHQVSIGETTWGGREELSDSAAVVDYGSLMYLALQRAKSAREAITVMTDLVAAHGYYSSGESFSIADPNEAWIMDMISKGKGNKGAVWVARRIPDGYIAGHANYPRIRQFPLNDKANCLYSPDVISFARSKGYFKGADEEFDFAEAYYPLDYGSLRACEARVWAMFNRAAPSLKLSMNYVKGVPGSQPFPLWIKPDKKLSVHDVMELMRDHFEGTDFDMTQDVGAGPFACPYRWRPMEWKVDTVSYVNERATSTQQTGFSFVSQMRSWLPGPIGGIHWFGVDDTYSTVYNPIYCGITRVPAAYAVGVADLYHFSWNSAFWTFNWVANFAYSRYIDMIRDIQVVQRDLEGSFLAAQPGVEAAAVALYQQSPALARDYLTEYSCTTAQNTVARWRTLGEDLMVKYMDGNVKTELNEVTHPPYPDSWYRRIVNERGEILKVRPIEKKK